MSDDRRARGLDVMERLSPGKGPAMVASLADIAPRFADQVVDFAFGDVCGHPVLDLKTREIATVAALTALGNARPQLVFHIRAARNLGCTRDEIVEVITQMAVYAGFPSALNGLAAAREAFADG